MSMLELANKIAGVYRQQFGRPVKVCPDPTGEPEDGRPVDFRIDRLKAEGFTPRHDWEAEIAATLALCRGPRP